MHESLAISGSRIAPAIRWRHWWWLVCGNGEQVQCSYSMLYWPGLRKVIFSPKNKSKLCLSLPPMNTIPDGFRNRSSLDTFLSREIGFPCVKFANPFAIYTSSWAYLIMNVSVFLYTCASLSTPMFWFHLRLSNIFKVITAFTRNCQLENRSVEVFPSVLHETQLDGSSRHFQAH